MRKALWAGIAAATVATVLSSGALAETGVGAYDYGRFNILAWSKAPPLATLGDDVIRMSSTPALGGEGWVIELHGKDSKWAEGEVRFLWTGRSEGNEIGRLRLFMSVDDFEVLTRLVDAELARAEPRTGALSATPGGPVTEIVVCTDGPGYVSERRVGGRQTWMAGFCGEDHPNDAIATLLQRAVLDYACGWFAMDRRCAADTDP